MAKSKQFKKLEKAAYRGEPAALYRLGIAYQLGRFVKQDLVMAAYCIYEAADLSYQPAKEWLEDYAFDDSAAVQGEA